MDMATRDDMGLVWMGPNDLIMQTEGNEHLFNQQTDNAYYQDSSQCFQGLDDMQSHLGMEGLDGLTEVESFCGDGSRRLVTLGSVADLPPPRKIRPVKHPGLKLKTPIAYQSDTDPSVIPIQKDGMAVCQKCGAIGVKHAFYTKERRFCSLACARGESTPENQSSSNNIKQENQCNQTQQNNQQQQNIQAQHHLHSSPNIQPQPIMQAPIQQTMHSPIQQQMSAPMQAPMQMQSQLQMQPQVQVLMPQMQTMQQIQPGLQTQMMSPQMQQQVAMQMQMAMPQMDQQMQLPVQQMQMQAQMGLSPMQLNMQLQPQMQMQPQIQNQMQQIQTQMQPQIQPQMQVLQTQMQMQCNAMQTQEDVHTEQHQWNDTVVKLEDSPPPPAPVMSPLPPLQLDEPLFPPDKRKVPDLLRTYEWDAKLSEPGFIAAPVSCFSHAPMSDSWDNITVGMKVEVQNTDCENFSEDFPDSFWVATVLKISGYKALLRYEGFGQNNSKDFWVNLCSSIVHHVGWCAIRGRPLIPPKTVEHKYSDWKEFLVKRLTGARTLPSNFYNKVHESLKSRFRCNLNVEVVDKNRISQVRVASIEKIVGKRLHVRYFNAEDDDSGFWCHEDSSLIHPVGWAHRVGHEISAPLEYLERCQSQSWDENDAIDCLFPLQQKQEQQFMITTNALANAGQTGFSEGMKLEAIDPLNLSSICVATIMKVLREGYIMIRIDSYDADVNCSDWFCYHQTSPCIFHAGFCQASNLTLTPPKGYDAGSFSWSSYLEQSQAIAAPAYLFKQNQDVLHHGFVEGMHLEATDIMDPRLVCVATVSRVVGRLLRVHFDGWEVEYDQWLDCSSPDMYPVGWCQLVAHKLEGPRVITPPKFNQGAGRAQRGVRGRRGRRTGSKRRGGVGMKKSPGGTLTQAQVPHMTDAAMPMLTQVDSPSGDDSIGDVTGGEDVVEPEMGVEPAGPDQTLPTASEAQQLSVTMATSIPMQAQAQVAATSNSYNCQSSWKVIPRLIDASSTMSSSDGGELNPSQWDVSDVAQFLRVNDCAAYCDNFCTQNIDGKALLNLTKDAIMDLTGMKVGPSLKILDLIQQLRIKVNPAQERAKANFKKFF